MARPWKGWLQQQVRKMILTEEVRNCKWIISRRKLPCQDKRRRCFVIITRGENLDVGRQERLYLADASFKTSKN